MNTQIILSAGTHPLTYTWSKQNNLDELSLEISWNIQELPSIPIASVYPWVYPGKGNCFSEPRFTESKWTMPEQGIR